MLGDSSRDADVTTARGSSCAPCVWGVSGQSQGPSSPPSEQRGAFVVCLLRGDVQVSCSFVCVLNLFQVLPLILAQLLRRTSQQTTESTLQCWVEPVKFRGTLLCCIIISVDFVLRAIVNSQRHRAESAALPGTRSLPRPALVLPRTPAPTGQQAPTPARHSAVPLVLVCPVGLDGCAVTCVHGYSVPQSGTLVPTPSVFCLHSTPSARCVLI